MNICRHAIFIRDLELTMSIGIHLAERRAPQRVRLNLEIGLVGPDSDAGDDIDNVLNYDIVRERVVALAQSRHFNLQETLCREIAETLADIPGVASLTVTSEKPDVYPDCAGVGYRLECTVSEG